MYNRRWSCSILVISTSFLTLDLYVSLYTLESIPPTLEVSRIDEGETYRGGTTLTIYARHKRMGLECVTAQIDTGSHERLKHPGTYTNCITWRLDTLSLADDKHLVAITTIDRSLLRNNTRWDLTFISDNTPPLIHIPSQSRCLGQGRILALFVQANDELTQLSGKLFSSDIVFCSVEPATHYRALVGIGATNPAKTYPVFLEATDLVGNTDKKTFQIKTLKNPIEQWNHIALSLEKQKVMINPSKGGQHHHLESTVNLT